MGDVEEEGCDVELGNGSESGESEAGECTRIDGMY
jgi:hypothetical protein